MSLDRCSSVRNRLLSDFQAAIEQRAQGRLSKLSLDIVEGAPVIEANAATYHAVQLVLAAVQAFTTASPKMTPAKLSFRVNGHPFVLLNPGVDDTTRQAIADHDSANHESFDSPVSFLADSQDLDLSASLESLGVV